MFKIHTSIYSMNKELNLSNFWKLVNNFYKSMTIRCLALKEDNLWKNIFFVAFLSRKSVNYAREEVKKDYENLMKLGVAKIDDLGIFFDVTPPEKVTKCIEQICHNGRLTLPEDLETLS